MDKLLVAWSSDLPAITDSRGSTGIDKKAPVTGSKDLPVITDFVAGGGGVAISEIALCFWAVDAWIPLTAFLSRTQGLLVVLLIRACCTGTLVEGFEGKGARLTFGVNPWS